MRHKKYIKLETLYENIMCFGRKSFKKLWLFNSHELVSSLGVSKAKKLIKLRVSFLLNNGSRHCIRQF